MRKAKTASIPRGKASTPPPANWQDWISSSSAPRDASGDPDALHEAISRLARSYWEQRGCQGGSAEEDWFRAEAEIHGRMAAGVAETAGRASRGKLIPIAD